MWPKENLKLKEKRFYILHYSIKLEINNEKSNQKTLN